MAQGFLMSAKENGIRNLEMTLYRSKLTGSLVALGNDVKAEGGITQIVYVSDKKTSNMVNNKAFKLLKDRGHI